MMKTLLRRRTGGLAVTVVVVALAGPADAQPMIREFGGLVSGSAPAGITAGPASDRAIWFAEYVAGRIGRITTGGTVTDQLPIQGPSAAPYGVALGPDDKLWFAAAAHVGAVTIFEQFFAFALPTTKSRPWGITTGPDGNLWFTESAASKIGKITPTGKVTEYATLTPNAEPQGITVGPDGNLWFTEKAASRIGRITTGGALSEFPIPTHNSQPWEITARPPGSGSTFLWFTESQGNKIGQVDTSGVVVTEYVLPAANSLPYGITVAPDGSVWFTESMGNKLGRIVPPSRRIDEWPVPTSGSMPWGITNGPGDTLWFTEYEQSQIGVVYLELAPPPGPSCAGDCDDSGIVTIDEILTMIDSALAQTDASACGFGDTDGDERITVDEILTAVTRALHGCPLDLTMQACLDSGGAVASARCCTGVGDFPNQCVIGACSCAPNASTDIRVCDCGLGRCFNGTTCVARPT